MGERNPKPVRDPELVDTRIDKVLAGIAQIDAEMAARFDLVESGDLTRADFRRWRADAMASREHKLEALVELRQELHNGRLDKTEIKQLRVDLKRSEAHAAETERVCASLREKVEGQAAQLAANERTIAAAKPNRADLDEKIARLRAHITALENARKKPDPVNEQLVGRNRQQQQQIDLLLVKNADQKAKLQELADTIKRLNKDLVAAAMREAGLKNGHTGYVPKK